MFIVFVPSSLFTAAHSLAAGGLTSVSTHTPLLCYLPFLSGLFALLLYCLYLCLRCLCCLYNWSDSHYNWCFLLLDFLYLGFNFATVSDSHLFEGLVLAVNPQLFYFLADFLAFLHLAKDDVLAIKMGGSSEGNKELGTIGVSACIGH